MSRQCHIQDCTSRASYGKEGEKATRCAQHKDPDMIDLVHPKCREDGCNKQPTYSFVGEKKRLYCVSHAKEGMVDIKHERCDYDGCATRPNFNFPGETKPIRCEQHKLPDMINIVNKVCAHEGCTTRPHFNEPGKKQGLYCIEHALEGMQNVLDKTCEYPKCSTRPCFNFPDKKISVRCAEHRLNGMINVKDKTCAKEGCSTLPSFNFEGQKPLYCAQHRLPSMIDTKNKMCSTPNCITLCKPKYQGFCLRCFIHNFPDEPVVKNIRIKEKHVTDFIKEKFPNLEMSLDKQITGACSKRRPDVLIDLYTHAIIVEVDEEQHTNGEYSCENKRMMQLFQDLGERPLVLIRFNPDKYTNKEGIVVKSCFKHHKTTGVPLVRCQKDLAARLDVLQKSIAEYVDNIPSKEISLCHLFYDGH
jgi:hypothetical protein